MQNRIVVGAALAVALLLAACSSGSSDDPTSTATTAPTGASAEPTDAPTEATTAAATEVPEAAGGAGLAYGDGSNDCQRNSDYAEAPVCMPPDIESVTITRSSPVTIVVVFRAAPTVNDWQLTIGFDLDNDRATGITDGLWADVHGIGPDAEVDYFAGAGANGAPLAQVHQIDPGPTFNLLEVGPPEDGEFAAWTWNDDRTLQVVIQDTVIPDSASMFYVAGQTMQPDYHDPFPDPDDGPLAFGG